MLHEMSLGIYAVRPSVRQSRPGMRSAMWGTSVSARAPPLLRSVARTSQRSARLLVRYGVLGLDRRCGACRLNAVCAYADVARRWCALQRREGEREEGRWRRRWRRRQLQVTGRCEGRVRSPCAAIVAHTRWLQPRLRVLNHHLCTLLVDSRRSAYSQETRTTILTMSKVSKVLLSSHLLPF